MGILTPVEGFAGFLTEPSPPGAARAEEEAVVLATPAEAEEEEMEEDEDGFADTGAEAGPGRGAEPTPATGEETPSLSASSVNSFHPPLDMAAGGEGIHRQRGLTQKLVGV